MVKRVLRLIGKLWQILGATALILVAAFLAIKIPYERLYENPMLWERVDNNDGPHIFWLDDDTVQMVNIRYDRNKRDFLITERRLRATEARAEMALRGQELGESTPVEDAASDFHAERIAAIGDIHGKFKHLVALLERNGVIDSKLDWNWNSGHLVVLGDVFDKGPSVTESLWFLRKLERQASRAGGRVHFLLGNHDYLFLKGNSQTYFPKYGQIADRLRIDRQELFGKDTELGRWLRTKGLAVKINDILFLHAGFSDSFLDRRVSLDDLNRLARYSLAAPHLLALTIEERDICRAIWGGSGPTGFRGYFDRSFPLGFLKAWQGILEEAEGAEATLDRALRFYVCRQMVVGHTETARIKKLYGGRLIAACIRLPAWDILEEDSQAEFVLFEGGRTYRVALDGHREEL
jgi:hypothetical protein